MPEPRIMAKMVTLAGAGGFQCSGPQPCPLLLFTVLLTQSASAIPGPSPLRTSLGCVPGEDYCTSGPHLLHAPQRPLPWLYFHMNFHSGLKTCLGQRATASMI